MNQIDQIKKMLDGLQVSTHSKIGVAITEHNRPDVFSKSYAEILKHLPPGAELVVVDDASTKPIANATFRFEKNAGIAKAKNKCLELLYLAGCEHFFLFDSDAYPLTPDWYKPYVESPEAHLNYIFKDFATGAKMNDCEKIYDDGVKTAWTHTRGCMLYYKRCALEKVGGMNTVFGKWGFEHMDLSNRIFNAGLTSFRFMDIVGSDKLIYSADEHREVHTTVGGQERKECLQRNREEYDSRKFSSEYFPFMEKKNIILTCYFTSVPDPQRGKKWIPNMDDLQELILSLKETKLLVFHDCFDVEDTDKVQFVKVNATVSPYIQKWITIHEWLMANGFKYQNVFCVDSTDVEVIKEPDWDNFGDLIFMGDENESVGCKWMVETHPGNVLSDFFKKNGSKQLLNCGLFGGSVENVRNFIRQVMDFHCFEKIVGTDMGVFNYIAYTNWFDKIRTGRLVCSLFKGFEKENKTAWFRHK